MEPKGIELTNDNHSRAIPTNYDQLKEEPFAGAQTQDAGEKTDNHDDKYGQFNANLNILSNYIHSNDIRTEKTANQIDHNFEKLLSREVNVTKFATDLYPAIITQSPEATNYSGDEGYVEEEVGAKIVVKHLDNLFAAGVNADELAKTMINYTHAYVKSDGHHFYGEKHAIIHRGINNVINNIDKFVKAGMTIPPTELVQSIVSDELSGKYQEERENIKDAALGIRDEYYHFRNYPDDEFNDITEGSPDPNVRDGIYSEIPSENAYELLERNREKLIEVGVPAETIDNFLNHNATPEETELPPEAPGPNPEKEQSSETLEELERQRDSLIHELAKIQDKIAQAKNTK